MNKVILVLLSTFISAHIFGQLNFTDETDSKKYKIEYRAIAGNDLARLRSYLGDTVFRKSGLTNFLGSDSRKANSMILIRVLRDKNTNNKIQKIEFYTTQSGTMLFKSQASLALPKDGAQINFLARIELLQL
jgi:hypothetical protein